MRCNRFNKGKIIKHVQAILFSYYCYPYSLASWIGLYQLYENLWHRGESRNTQIKVEFENNYLTLSIVWHKETLVWSLAAMLLLYRRANASFDIALSSSNCLEEFSPTTVTEANSMRLIETYIRTHSESHLLHEFVARENFWMRWLSRSLINIFPPVSKLRVVGEDNWFDAEPLPPKHPTIHRNPKASCATIRWLARSTMNR